MNVTATVNWLFGAGLNEKRILMGVESDMEALLDVASRRGLRADGRNEADKEK